MCLKFVKKNINSNDKENKHFFIRIKTQKKNKNEFIILLHLLLSKSITLGYTITS